MTGRLRRFTPSNDINARMPPSPSLSTRIAKPTYLTHVTTISVQTISDSAPSTACGSLPPRPSTVFSVYSGLVPMSPNTTPSAPILVVVRPGRGGTDGRVIETRTTIGDYARRALAHRAARFQQPVAARWTARPDFLQSLSG